LAPSPPAEKTTTGDNQARQSGTGDGVPGQERYGRGDGSFPAFEASDHVAQGVAPVSRSMALEPAEKQAAKEYLAPNCVPKDTVPFEVPHCLRRR
jgi:hypothetical protein